MCLLLKPSPCCWSKTKYFKLLVSLFDDWKWKEADGEKQLVQLVYKCPGSRVYRSLTMKYCNSPWEFPKWTWGSEPSLGMKALGAAPAPRLRGSAAPAPHSHVAYLKALYSNALWFFQTQSQEGNKSSDSCITVQLVSFVEYKLDGGCHGPLKAELAECRTGSDKSR